MFYSPHRCGKTLHFLSNNFIHPLATHFYLFIQSYEARFVYFSGFLSHPPKDGAILIYANEFIK